MNIIKSESSWDSSPLCCHTHTKLLLSPPQVPGWTAGQIAVTVGERVAAKENNEENIDFAFQLARRSWVREFLPWWVLWDSTVSIQQATANVDGDTEDFFFIERLLWNACWGLLGPSHIRVVLGNLEVLQMWTSFVEAQGLLQGISALCLILILIFPALPAASCSPLHFFFPFCFPMSSLHFSVPSSWSQMSYKSLE